METFQRRAGDELAPQVRLEEAAIAILLERIANLDREVKDDLMSVLIDIKDCESEQDLREIEQTIREILFPRLAGGFIQGRAGDARATDTLRKRSEWIGDKIRKLRTQKELTQEQLASASGLPQSHISRLEKGQHSPSHVTLTKLAAALGVQIGDIDPASDE